ncbi:MAG TPA: hypothetical protein VNT01_10590 [Symbiobacteriaceae bacterium]|nr:hypothetical protein [Symbiobacteriaceae bacterium]
MATNQQNQQNKNTEGTTSITGSQITSASGGEYQPTGNAAAQGAMGITGSITTETPDKYAGGAPKDFPRK